MPFVHAGSHYINLNPTGRSLSDEISLWPSHSEALFAANRFFREVIENIWCVQSNKRCL